MIIYVYTSSTCDFWGASKIHHVQFRGLQNAWDVLMEFLHEPINAPGPDSLVGCGCYAKKCLKEIQPTDFGRCWKTCDDISMISMRHVRFEWV